MSETIQLHQCADTPFSHKAGETFYVGLTFNYDVSLVLFSMEIFALTGGAAIYTWADTDWVLTGTRKKSITRTPAQTTSLVPGQYRLKVKHTYPDGRVKYRFDSILTVI